MSEEITPELLKEWQRAAIALKQAKDVEKPLRDKIVNSIYDSPQDYGTKKIQVGEIEAKVQSSLSLSVDNAEIRAIMEDLTEEEKNAIEWKPVVKKKEFDLLPKDSKLRAFTTAKRNTPSLVVLNLEL